MNKYQDKIDKIHARPENDEERNDVKKKNTAKDKSKKHDITQTSHKKLRERRN